MGGGLGGEGSELEVLEWREEDLDMRRWWACWRLGERERRWPGLGVEDGYGRRVEREARWSPWGEGVGDMGRRWRAWRRLGERERWWRGLGVGVAYGRRGAREARWGSRGEGEVDVGRRWRTWWRPGEREQGERGPGGLWWRVGERLPCVERERWGWVRRAGGGVGAPPFAGPGLFAARVGPVRRCWRVLGCLAWCCLVLRGGGIPRPPLIRHVGVRWRQRLEVRVK